MNKILLGICALLLVAVGYLFVQVQALKPAADTASARALKAMDGNDDDDDEEVNLGLLMGHQQRYAEKLHWAIAAQNQPLADFYLHELEEISEEIMDAKLTKNGHNITQYTKLHLLPQVETLEKAVKAANWPAATEGYRSLVQSCNNCHRATGYDFVHITVPTRQLWTNQDFSPIGK